MKSRTVVRARIDGEIKTQAESILADMGLTASDAIRILLTKIAKERRFPIDLAPNALTLETIRISESGTDVHHATDTDDLFAQLGI